MWLFRNTFLESKGERQTSIRPSPQDIFRRFLSTIEKIYSQNARLSAMRKLDNNFIARENLKQ